MTQFKNDEKTSIQNFFGIYFYKRKYIVKIYLVLLPLTSSFQKLERTL